MNFTHKCHFHPQNTITKFCPQEACTLPLCQACESIHLQAHKSNFQDVKLVRFNEAYLNAINQIQDFLQKETFQYKQLYKRLEDDREAVIKFIENYYSAAIKVIQQAKDKLIPLQEKLMKLKKGSIKTLIFFYSGDIKFQKEQLHFRPLNEKLKAIQISRQKIITQNQKNSINLEKVKIQNKQLDKKVNTKTNDIYSGNIQPQKTIQTIINNKNALERVPQPQPKHQQKQRQKNRKSIFESLKKPTPNESQVKQKVTKHNYNISNQQDTYLINPSPTFTYLPKYHDQVEDVNANFEVNFKIQRKEQPLAKDQKVSIQNQLNKYTGAEQYQAYKKYRDEKLFQQLNYHQNKPIQQRPNIQHKILKSSDLDVDKIEEKIPGKVNQKYNNFKQNVGQRTNPQQQTLIANQRARSMSQANIVNREVNNTTFRYDLKKQVLPPQQIRKMLEKRIQERNKILSIKKGEVPWPNEDQNIRKNWGQTKDSIINQIYQARY